MRTVPLTLNSPGHSSEYRLSHPEIRGVHDDSGQDPCDGIHQKKHLRGAEKRENDQHVDQPESAGSDHADQGRNHGTVHAAQAAAGYLIGPAQKMHRKRIIQTYHRILDDFGIRSKYLNQRMLVQHQKKHEDQVDPDAEEHGQPVYLFAAVRMGCPIVLAGECDRCLSERIHNTIRDKIKILSRCHTRNTVGTEAVYRRLNDHV